MSEWPGHLHASVAEMLSIELDAADKRRLWAVILGLTPKRDGNQWFVMLGDNLQEGVCGFGDSPADAMNNFEHEMYKSTKAIKP